MEQVIILNPPFRNELLEILEEYRVEHPLLLEDIKKQNRSYSLWIEKYPQKGLYHVDGPEDGQDYAKANNYTYRIGSYYPKGSIASLIKEDSIPEGYLRKWLQDWRRT